MAVDFSSPFVAGAIVLKTGQRFPFWTNAGQEGTASAQAFSGGSSSASDTLAPGLESMAWIQEVNVELELSHLPIISISLAPPFREGMEFINSELIEYGVSTLEVQLGYVSDSADRSLLSPVFSGVMTNPEVTIGQDIVITLNAQGTVGWALSRQTGGRVAEPYESRKDFITRIIKGPGSKRRIEIDDSAIATSLDSQVRQLWEGGLEYAQGGKSDWLAVWELCNAANVRPFMEGNKIRFVPIADDLAREPKKIFRLFDYPQGNIGQAVDAQGSFGEDPQQGVYPIVQFSSPSQPLYLPSSVREFVMKEVKEGSPRDPVVPERIGDASEKVVRSDAGQASPEDNEINPGAEEGTADGPQVIPGDPEKQEEVKSARAEYWREGNMGLQVEIETIGVPDLIPGDTIVVEGVGTRFGHPRWGVFKVRHSIGLGGFTTELTAVSNTDRLLRSGQAALGTPNEKKPKLSESTTEVVAEALGPNDVSDSDLL